MDDGSLIPRFGRARRDPALAVLEGFHPLKHALRFGAELEIVVTRDVDELERLAARLARALEVPRVRRATKPTKASRTRRLEAKRRASSRKRERGRPAQDD